MMNYLNKECDLPKINKFVFLAFLTRKFSHATFESEKFVTLDIYKSLLTLQL